MSESTDSDVLFAEQGSLGRITLNRPKAINALTHGMIRAIDAALQKWADNPAIRIILLEGSGERGFCAGGDIRALYEDAKAGRFSSGDSFFRDEYRLNARISEYAKPIVAFMDGIVMGGGIGLSAHASHRVVTPRSILAMPEVGIGFIPDVGGTFLLANAPSCLGFHAALTACRLPAADALLLNLADFYIPAERLADIAASLARCQNATSLQLLLEANAQPVLPGALDAARQWINLVYAHPTLEAILAAMQSCEEPGARAAWQEIAGKSPTSLKVALRLLQEARGSTQLRSCLQREYDAALVCIRNHDFVEGVRAAVVDKDRTPRWSPGRLTDVTPHQVDMYFHSSTDTALF